jgi:hypothetical protein
MGKPRMPQPVKLFVGLLSSDEDLLRRARQRLAKLYGPVDLESDIRPFDQTDYYEPEMGAGLKRWFLSFARLINPRTLPEIKRDTNDLETEIAEQCLWPAGLRPANIDPGYVDLGKLVLATTKDRSHRVYLDAGIYAESTLHFVQGQWQTWPWTYPDYQQPEFLAYFLKVRERLKTQRRDADEHSDRGDQPPRRRPEDLHPDREGADDAG